MNTPSLFGKPPEMPVSVYAASHKAGREETRAQLIFDLAKSTISSLCGEAFPDRPEQLPEHRVYNATLAQDLAHLADCLLEVAYVGGIQDTINPEILMADLIAREGRPVLLRPDMTPETPTGLEDVTCPAGNCMVAGECLDEENCPVAAEVVEASPGAEKIVSIFDAMEEPRVKESMEAAEASMEEPSDEDYHAACAAAEAEVDDLGPF